MKRQIQSKFSGEQINSIDSHRRPFLRFEILFSHVELFWRWRDVSIRLLGVSGRPWRLVAPTN
jgi:hypothetical protein